MSALAHTPQDTGSRRRPMQLVKPGPKPIKALTPSALESLVSALAEMTLAKPGFAATNVVPIRLGQGA